jgi:ABC-type transport system involved in multi-copper enzyme maturation permease subunit
MTTETQQRPATPASGAVKGNPWHPTFRGVALATWIELLRRRPSAKGYVFYGVVVLGIVALGVLAAVNAGPGKNSIPFELVLVLILGAGILIGPSLAATSINGDSSEGVLAPLQMTRLTAGDLAFGKLLASWIVCVAALLTTIPLLVYSFGRSGWHLGEALAVIGMILFVVLAFTAVGLAWSAIAARAVASVSLTHLTSGLFVIGTLLLFFFTLPLVSEDVQVTYRYYDWEAATPEQQQDPAFDYTTLPCVEEVQTESFAHSDKNAWLLLLNPLVTVAEASPLVDPETYEQDGRAAPGIFAFIHSNVADARLGSEPPTGYDDCAGYYGEDNWEERQREQALMEPAAWPGIAASALLAIGSLWIVVRRLRVPYKKLRTGTRVA